MWKKDWFGRYHIIEFTCKSIVILNLIEIIVYLRGIALYIGIILNPSKCHQKISKGKSLRIKLIFL